MRDLNECQAEVFRRSEKRIKERKQRRNHMLMVCVPLVLCITIAGVYYLPHMGNDSPAFTLATEIACNQYSDTMATDCIGVMFAGRVEISGNGLSRVVSAVEDVQGIMRLIDHITNRSETAQDDGTVTIMTQEDAVDLESGYMEKGYQILIKHGDGTDTAYLLIGSLLIQKTTGEGFHMDESTCFALKEALGIPLY